MLDIHIHIRIILPDALFNGTGYTAGHAIATAAGCEVVRADDGTPLAYNKPDLHNPWFIVRRKDGHATTPYAHEL